MDNKTKAASLTVIQQRINELIRFTRSDKPLLIVLDSTNFRRKILSNALIDRVKDYCHTIRVPAERLQQPPTLARLLADQWQIKISRRHKTIESQLHTILLRLTNREQTSLLIIEDAHTLPLIVLAAISHLTVLQDGIKTRLHILLSGENELLNKIQNLHFQPLPYLCLDSLQHDDACEMIKTSLYTPAEQNTINLDNVVEYAPPKSQTTTNTESQKSANPLLHRIKIGLNPVKLASMAALCCVIVVCYQFNHPSFNDHASPSLQTSKQGIGMQTLAQFKQKPYTLQLMSSQDEKKTNQFIQSHHLQNKVEKIYTRQRNKNRFELIYGHYATLNAAKTAKHHLPTGLKKLKPWIRKL